MTNPFGTLQTNRFGENSVAWSPQDACLVGGIDICVFVFVYLCICVFVYLCICVFVCLCICVFVYLCLAKWDNLVTTAVHLLVVHFSKCFSPDIIIHSGMLSWLTDKKYISSAVISRGEAAETCKKCKYQILFVIALTIGDPSKQITVVVSN